MNTRRLGSGTVVIGAALAILVLTATSLWLIWSQQDALPHEIAVHWGPSGLPDRFAPLSEVLLTQGFLMVVFPLVLLPIGYAARAQREMSAFAVGLAVFMGTTMTWSTLAQRGLTDQTVRRAVTGPAPLVGGLAGLAVGLLVWLAVRRPGAKLVADRSRALDADAPRVPGASPTSQLAWTGQTRVTRWVALAALPLALLVVLVVWAAMARQWALAALVLLLLAGVAVLYSSIWSQVVADRRGLRVRGLGVLPWATVPLASVESASLDHVSAMADYGGYGVRTSAADGTRGVVTSSGEAVRIKRAGEPDFIVTVDDAEGLAATLNTLVEQQA